MTADTDKSPEQSRGITVLGKTVDDRTRCIHYSGPTDVVAMKFKCCRTYYPCFDCHHECADHRVQRWRADEWDEKAVLCGVCRTELPIRTYLGVRSCPHCRAEFNERCRLHRHLYFEAAEPGNAAATRASERARPGAGAAAGPATTVAG